MKCADNNTDTKKKKKRMKNTKKKTKIKKPIKKTKKHQGSPGAMHYVFRSIVALHSIRLKLCSVKYIAHCFSSMEDSSRATKTYEEQQQKSESTALR